MIFSVLAVLSYRLSLAQKTAKVKREPVIFWSFCILIFAPLWRTEIYRHNTIYFLPLQLLQFRHGSA